MVLKVYLTVLSLYATAAAVVFITGNLSAIVTVVFGFIAFGLVFLGMMFVLPFTVSHPAPAKIKKSEPKKQAPAPGFNTAPAQNRRAHA